MSARLNKKNKTEFYQTMESLKSLVKPYCYDLDINVVEDKNVFIRIMFNEKDELEKNFYNNEFTILKGSVRSLCNDLIIKVNDVSIN